MQAITIDFDFFLKSFVDSLCIRLNHDVTVCEDGGHDGRAEDRMNQNSDRDASDRMERRKAK